MDQSETQRQKLRDARKKLQELTELIEIRTKELAQLRKDKKATEALIEALDDSLGTHSFVENQNFPWSSEVKDRLNNVFGIKSFRGLQETVINCTLSGKDCIYIAATGSGKSLVFQLPALISSGITLVVSPLLSLMEDQVTQLDDLGIPSIVLNSTTSREDARLASNAMVDSNSYLKLIYVTPEKLAKSKYIMSQIENMYNAGRFSRLVIDEVHCCSEWGHDFRKDYSALHIFKRQFPETPILGLTATATPQVILDIKKMLNIPKSLVYKGSFYRPNLVYEIRTSSNKDNVNDIIDLLSGRFQNQSGIIYCLTIRDTEDVADKLRSFGLNCLAYHAQLDIKDRTRIQKEWYTGRCKVIAATVAFGLGINKMDVRFVIHNSISKSIENYYQETGRAGRDGQPAFCVGYYRFSDVFRATSLTFRERNGKERVYQMLSYCLNRQTCRKRLIADYFEDNLVKDKNDLECCDNCRYKNRNPSDEFVDASDWLDNLLEILRQAHRGNEKMTANKLIEAWMQVKGPKKLRLEGINRPMLSRTDCETVVASLLCQGYLQENFHITPYNTISYMMAGPQAMIRSSRRGQSDLRPLIHKASLESFYGTTTGHRPTTTHDSRCDGPSKVASRNHTNGNPPIPMSDQDSSPDVVHINDPKVAAQTSWDDVECLIID